MAVNVAIQEYQTSSNTKPSSEQSRLWRRLAFSKCIGVFFQTIDRLGSYRHDADSEKLLHLADELKQVLKKADARAVFYRPRDKKSRLYTGLIRAWIDAGGFLGASEEGPLQRFLCRIAKIVPFRLGARGAKAVIEREKERRAALTILSEALGAQGRLSAGAFTIDQLGNRKSD
jgi:hypothetical protein